MILYLFSFLRSSILVLPFLNKDLMWTECTSLLFLNPQNVIVSMHTEVIGV